MAIPLGFDIWMSWQGGPEFILLELFIMRLPGEIGGRKFDRQDEDYRAYLQFLEEYKVCVGYCAL
jgi:hypothetical protein